MAITKARKVELVAQYNDVLSQADGFVVAEYNRMSVAEMEELRHKMRESEGEFIVTKNTLFKIALEQAEWPVPEDLLVGPVGVAFSKGDLPKVAKSVLDFAKDMEEKFTIKGGVMGASVFPAGDLKAVSEMPSLDELRAQLLGTLVLPAQLAGLVEQPTRELVSVFQAASVQLPAVLQAYINKQESGESAA